MDYQSLIEVLGLPEPWIVTDLEVDKPSNRIDITLSCGKPKKSFFGGKQDQTDLISLRHLPIFGMRAFLNIPENALSENPVFGATPTSRMTDQLENWIIATLEHTRSYQGVSKITGVTPADAREVAERTGAGIKEIEISDEPKVVSQSFTTGSSLPEETQSFDIQISDVVPIETHDNWQLLINGEIPVHSNAVGLKMLLQKVRQEVAEDPSEITRLNAAKTLRQYFIRNQKAHREEISLIAGDLGDSNIQAIRDDILDGSSSVQSSGLPEENHEAWGKVLNGTTVIATKNVGLQMMLERLRLSIMQSPGTQGEANARKILRQFFQKHSSRLSNEISQLGFQAPFQENMGSASSTGTSIPVESDQCWKKLIENDFTIQTEQVGLQMMLERVRMTLTRNPSESNYMASIKILRQYFLKHQSSHQNELEQLRAHSSASMISNSSSSAIPLETDLIWHRLIDGDIQIQTNAVAFNMMLERVRQSVDKNPSDSNRQAGVKLLRQYFIKHQQTHQAELSQLVAA